MGTIWKVGGKVFHMYFSKLAENFLVSEENVRKAHNATGPPAWAVWVKPMAPVAQASSLPFPPPIGAARLGPPLAAVQMPVMGEYSVRSTANLASRLLSEHLFHPEVLPKCCPASRPKLKFTLL